MKISKSPKKSLLFIIAAVFCSVDAWAIGAPTSTTAFLYPLYKIIVLDIGAGPTMFAIAFIGVCVAAFYLFNNKLANTLSSLVATALIVGAAGIVATLGMTF